MHQLRKALPDLGLGLGLRTVHFDHILNHWPEVDWFEIISENFMVSGGYGRKVLAQVAERYPIVMHGVSMSIGSTAPLDRDYLQKLKQLAADVKPAWISDHLCWTGVLGINSHDLLPVPLNEETFKHIFGRVKEVQDFLERPLVLENPSTYLSFTQSSIPEGEFLSRLASETGCGLLLDVNNVYVTCFNNDLDPMNYLEQIDMEAVVQFHLAGHQNLGTHIIDTHDNHVIDQVWELYRHAWQKTNNAATLLEWDSDIPPFEELHAELLKAKKYRSEKMPVADLSAPSAPVVSSQENVSNPVDFLVPDVG